MEVYQSEVSRLKLLLAAKAGDEDLVNFLRKEWSGDVAELRKRLMQVTFFTGSNVSRNISFLGHPTNVFLISRGSSLRIPCSTLIFPIT
jgi:hypothetical protein